EFFGKHIESGRLQDVPIAAGNLMGFEMTVHEASPSARRVAMAFRPPLGTDEMNDTPRVGLGLIRFNGGIKNLINVLQMAATESKPNIDSDLPDNRLKILPQVIEPGQYVVSGVMRRKFANRGQVFFHSVPVDSLC